MTICGDDDDDDDDDDGDDGDGGDGGDGNPRWNPTLYWVCRNGMFRRGETPNSMLKWYGRYGLLSKDETQVASNMMPRAWRSSVMYRSVLFQQASSSSPVSFRPSRALRSAVGPRCCRFFHSLERVLYHGRSMDSYSSRPCRRS